MAIIKLAGKILIDAQEKYKKLLKLNNRGVITFLLLLTIACPSYPQVIIDKLGAAFPLLNGYDINSWHQSGNANWYPITPNGVAAEQGAGLLLGRLAFTDFQLQFNYWIGKNTSFSIFVHCIDPNHISSNTALEINLSNKAIKKYGAGSVVGEIKGKSTPMVLNQWNSVTISSISNQLTITINGITTVDQENYFKFPSGPFAIQYGDGELKIANLNATIPGRW